MERSIIDALEGAAEVAEKTARLLEHADELMDELTGALGPEDEDDDDAEDTKP